MTEELIRAGAKVVALEPSDGLASLLEDRYTGLAPEKLSVSRVPFELFETSSNFELLAAANSFHWLDPDVSYRKAADLLKPQGRLCLFWYFPIIANTRHQHLVNSCVRDLGLDDLVREPDGYRSLIQETLKEGRTELDESGYVRCVDWVLKARRITYSVATYCDLLATYVGSKSVEDLYPRLSSTVFQRDQNVELVVYEYACVAEPVGK